MAKWSDLKAAIANIIKTMVIRRLPVKYYGMYLIT